MFVAFQMSFAAITAALVIGALVERVRFGAVMLFAVLWLTIVYAPLAHMVWAAEGLLFAMGAIDFAGGTVVHINAGIAGLVGALFAGPAHRPPEGSDAAALAGADDGRRRAAVGRLVRVQRRLGARGQRAGGDGAGQHLRRAGRRSAGVDGDRAAGVGQAVDARRRVGRGRRAGRGDPGGGGQRAARARCCSGAAASLACYGFVGSLKNRLKLDDSLDVFGIHGLGGIVGSIGTALVALPALGGHGARGLCARAPAAGRQLAAVAVAIAWSAAGSALCFAAVRRVTPLRHDREREREGLDLSDHGERAYNY